jgi:transmembrane sensor
MSTPRHAAAVQWWLKLQNSESDPQLFIEWQRWLQADSAHRTAFALLEHRLRMKMGERSLLPTIEEMRADSYDGACPVSEWRPKRRSLARYLKFAAAASISLPLTMASVIFVRGHYLALHGSYSYQTGVGERKVLRLPEGSEITLDANSSLEVSLTPQRRSLRLAGGEAYFQVAKDAQRPFVVQAGGAEVRAVGTAFDVRISQDLTVVAVTEGRVEMRSAPSSPASIALLDTALQGGVHSQTYAGAPAVQVSAGEAKSFGVGSGLRELPQSQASLATTWLQGRRQYRNEPLRYVLADIDRCTGRHIKIVGEATGELKFTGTLSLENSRSWLKGLGIALPVTISETESGEVVVQAR